MTSPLRIGIAGLGTVGASLFRLLSDNKELIRARAGRDIVVTAVSARDRSRDRGVDFSACAWHDDPVSLARDPQVDVVVELMGGADGAAYETVKTALSLKKPVVTANKALLSTHAAAIASWLGGDGVLAYEAAVAGAIPVIKTLRESLAGNRFASIAGIMNGTCNFILSTMETTGRAFADVLAEAQQRGYAEAEPSFDIDGIDAAHKLSILCGLAFGVLPDKTQVTARGIRAVSAADMQAAESFGYKIRLIGKASTVKSGIVAEVAPRLVSLSSPFSRVMGAQNAILVQASHAGPIFMQGAGAGGPETASAVAADIIDVARGVAHPFVGVSSPGVLKTVSGDDTPGMFYVASDTPLGSLGANIDVLKQTADSRAMIVDGASRRQLEQQLPQARLIAVES